MVSHTGSQSQLQQGPPDPPKGVAALTNLFSNGCARISNRTQGARALGSLSLIPSVHPSVYPWGKGTQAKDNTLSCKLLYALKCSVIRYRKHTPKKLFLCFFFLGEGTKFYLVLVACQRNTESEASNSYWYLKRNVFHQHCGALRNNLAGDNVF
jgi:hypothetical protein